MKYTKIIEGRFINRPNRFVAEVEVGGRTITAHVKNTGRCRELLVEGAMVYLEDFSDNMGTRKLPYSLIGVKKVCDDGRILMINMDSQAPNKVVAEALKDGKISLPGMSEMEIIKGEEKVGDSRLDFYVRDKNGAEGYIEVKGVTLEKDKIVSFPDAPTLRGIKHLNELSALVNKGYYAYVIFVVQMEGVEEFRPDEERHYDFAKALRDAKENGVHVLAYQCNVGKNTLNISLPIKTVI